MSTPATRRPSGASKKSTAPTGFWAILRRARLTISFWRARARARRSFWSTAATGAAAFILTVGPISVTVMWKQHADIHRSPSDKPGFPTGLTESDWLVAKPLRDTETQTGAPAAQSSVMLERPTSEEDRSAASASSEPSTTVSLELGPPARDARLPARSKLTNVTRKIDTTGIKRRAHRVCWLKHGYYRKCTWYRHHHRYRYYE